MKEVKDRKDYEENLSELIELLEDFRDSIEFEKELEYKKYTIKDLEEMKKILQDLKTEEVRLVKVKKCIDMKYC